MHDNLEWVQPLQPYTKCINTTNWSWIKRLNVFPPSLLVIICIFIVGLFLNVEWKRIFQQAPKDKVIPEVEYNLVDDLKKEKANISLFELLKIPSIRENLPKNMILNKSREVQNNNLEMCAKLDGQNTSMKRVPPFLLNFEIFNRNVHNCMIDSGAS